MGPSKALRALSAPTTLTLDARMELVKTILMALGGFIAVMAILAFIPSALALILDPINKTKINAECKKACCEVTEIKAWPNHYGVKVQKNNEEHYLKCRVSFKGITWKGKSPESL